MIIFKKKYKNSKSRGFTLVELLVVISIIGLLSSVVLANVKITQSKARDAERIRSIRQIQTALEFYYDKYGKYPDSSSCFSAPKNFAMPSLAWCNSVDSLSNGQWIGRPGQRLGEFMSNDPLDPAQGSTANWLPSKCNTFFYNSINATFNPNNKYYVLLYCLENYPHSIEATDGYIAPNGDTYHWGTNTNGVITVGGGNCDRINQVGSVKVCL